MTLLQAAKDIVAAEPKFVYDLYLAAELEVRSTERWLLVALGGIYSYLATKRPTEIPLRLRRLAWYSPTFIVLFAGLRALGLGLRQGRVMDWMKTAECKVPGAATVGWAHVQHRWVVTGIATAFYVALAIATFLIARRMISAEELPPSAS